MARRAPQKAMTAPPPPRRRTSWGRRIWNFIQSIVTLVLLAALGVVAVAALYFLKVSKELPTPEDLVNYSPGGMTEIFATDKGADGKNIRLARVFSGENREFASIIKIPGVLQNATVAIEDERFYNHPGVDVKGIARALYVNVRGGHVLDGQGGSTLTQQLARNVYLNKRKTMDRKAQEMLLAVQIENNFSKQQILEFYLNEVYYGHKAYGVQAAAKVYFGKKLKDLTLAEAALIAGLPQRPNDLDPYKNPKAAKERRNTILAKMAELGYITLPQAKKAQKQPVKTAGYKPPSKDQWKAPYFVDYVLNQLVRRYGKDTVYKGGLKVYTTLNWHMQLAAEKALRDGITGASGERVTEGALVCVEPRTGFIRAMVGGKDYKRNQFNNAAQGKRQPGSSFKVFVYTAAIDSRPDRYSQYSSVDNSRISYPNGRRRRWVPASGGPPGSVPMRTALAYSYNRAAVNTANTVGIRRVVDYARRMGIESEIRPTLAAALGAYPVSPLEMASAYAIFPNHGDRAAPMAVYRILDHEGAILEEAAPQVERDVISENAVANLSDMMQSVIVEGTASKARGIHDIPNAHGKTGTTNDNKDAWFVGYTPQLSAAVWLSGPRFYKQGDHMVPHDYQPMAGVTGGHVCAPIWAAFMKSALPIQRKSGMPALPPAEKLLPGNDDTPKTDVTQKKKNRRGRNTALLTGDEAAAEIAPLPAEETPATQTVAAPTGGETLAPPRRNASTTAAQTRPEPAAAAAPALSVPAATFAAASPASAASAPRSVGTLARASAAVVAAPRAAAAPTFTAAPAAVLPRPVVPRPAPTVTVTLCADSGRRATRWCPETLTQTFPAGRAPRDRCRVHRPRPGDG